MDEKDLLERLKLGDALAFKEVFNFYIRKVYQFVYGYVKDKMEAEDITQVVFQKIWENRTALNTDKSFNSYLFTIAYRTTIDYFRQSAAIRHIKDIESLNDEGLFTELSADYLLNQHQFQSLYQKALDSLTAKRKEIFLLSRHEGISNKDIADKLNISVKTVENHMTAALFTLREFFKKAALLSFLYFF